MVAHIAFGPLQAGANTAVLLILTMSMVLVTGLNLLAARRDAADEQSLRAAFEAEAATSGWVEVGDPTTIPNGRARTVELADGSRVAIFRHGGDKLSAVSNVCAHQNGPLGEGRMIGGAITCPWHGYNYRPENGCSPPPFTEKIATYNLSLVSGRLLLDPTPNPPGTFVAPLIIPPILTPAPEARP